MEELRGVLAQAQALLNAAGSDGEDAVRQVHDKVTASLALARATLEDLEDDANRYVRDHPRQALGIAAAMGVLVGVLVGRRR